MMTGRVFYEGRILPVTLGDSGDPCALGGERLDGAASFLPPCEPTKIVCVGRNYAQHAKELGNEVPAEPLLFLKPSSSLLDPDGTIELPPTSISNRVEHEAELAVVIGRRARRVSEEEAGACVFGCTAAGDVYTAWHAKAALVLAMTMLDLRNTIRVELPDGSEVFEAVDGQRLRDASAAAITWVKLWAP